MKGSRLFVLVALCLLTGSEWLLQQAWPSEMAWPFESCLHFALIGLIGLSIATLQGGWGDLSTSRAAAVASAGVCLFAAPSAVLQFAAGNVPEYTSAALFCAVPLMTILAAISFQDAEGQRLRGLMVSALIGLAGALLLFPMQSPGSLRRWLFLGLVVACCIVVALASVWMHRLMQGLGIGVAMAAAGLMSAAVLGVYGLSAGWPRPGIALVPGELLRCALFDLPIVWLTVWLAREVSPARLAARFLLVPLVTILEGYALERGPVDSRAILAVVLLCAGGAMLLFKQEPDEIPSLLLP